VILNNYNIFAEVNFLQISKKLTTVEEKIRLRELKKREREELKERVINVG